MPVPIEQSLNAYVLPELPSFDLPPLPKITDAKFYELAVTHSSTHGLPRRAHELDIVEGDFVQDYEKLEHVGDGLLRAVVTALLHDIYPELREGPATMLKGHLVCNATLAQLADRYGITRQLIAAPSALYVTRAQQKTKGSMFESWIAAVFYSYLGDDEGETVPKDETEAPENPWPAQEKLERGDENSEDQDEDNEGDEDEEEDFTDEDESTSEDSSDQDESGNEKAADDKKRSIDEKETTVGDDTSSDVPSGPDKESVASAALLAFKHLVIQGKSFGTQLGTSCSPGDEKQVSVQLKRRTRGQAYDHIDAWLRPLFIPIAKWALECMRNEQKRLEQAGPREDVPELWLKEDDVAAGAKGVLHVYTSNKYDNQPEYTTERAGPGLWKSTIVVTDKAGKQWTDEGTRHTKKSASAVAAYRVCLQMKLVEPVKERPGRET